MHTVAWIMYVTVSVAIYFDLKSKINWIFGHFVWLKCQLVDINFFLIELLYKNNITLVSILLYLL